MGTGGEEKKLKIAMSYFFNRLVCWQTVTFFSSFILAPDSCLLTPVFPPHLTSYFIKRTNVSEKTTAVYKLITRKNTPERDTLSARGIVLST